jgi:hypothetical protein
MSNHSGFYRTEGAALNAPHHEGFNRALENALRNISPGDETRYNVRLKVKATQRPNPGWVIEYIVALEETTEEV